MDDNLWGELIGELGMAIGLGNIIYRDGMSDKGEVVVNATDT